MFKNICVPISSEYYSKEVLKRAVFLAERFDSKITLYSILEEQTLEQVAKQSSSYRTPYDRSETKKDRLIQHRKTSANIIFDDAKHLLKNKSIPYREKVVEGTFGEVIKREIDAEEYDLILMGFKKGCALDYSFFYQLDIPIWIESEHKDKSILAICSNLAPNQRVPKISMELAEKLDWKLKMLYVVDVQDSVEVDENGERSEKKPEQVLTSDAQKFIDEMKKKNIDVEMIKGNIPDETDDFADKIDAGLVVIGRMKKKKGVLGLPAGNVRQKMAGRCDHSILFVN
ncbi:MAG: universal stress protein [Candidatus Thermoplasmatota archaeon]